MDAFYAMGNASHLLSDVLAGAEESGGCDGGV
jgi:hypothetical protein